VKRPCAHPTCPRLIEAPRVRCQEHQAEREAGRRQRGLTGSRGSTWRWRKLRRRILERDGYCCVKCDAPYPLEVDHINGDPENNRSTNLQTLCVPCHHDKHRG